MGKRACQETTSAQGGRGDALGDPRDTAKGGFLRNGSRVGEGRSEKSLHLDTPRRAAYPSPTARIIPSHPDGSTWPACARRDQPDHGVVEYHVTLDGQITPELFCLVTDLLDHTTHPAHLLADAYRWR